MRLALATALMLVLAVPAPAATPPVRNLTIHHWDCPFYSDGGSCALPETAEVWRAPGTGRFDFWHEVGHVFDHQALSDVHRAWFTRLLGFPEGTPWFREGDEEDRLGVASPGERFADAFASCWLHKRPAGAWTTGYGYYPSPRQHLRACNAIAVLDLLD